MLSRREEIEEYWSNTLAKVPIEIFEQRSFPSETADFLINVGLPLDVRLQNDLHPAFQFTPHSAKRVTFQETLYLAIGMTIDRFLKENHYFIALREDNGEAFLVPLPDSISQSAQFLNSDIQSLLLCLQVRLRFSPRMRELGDQEQVYYTEQIKQTLSVSERRTLLHTILDEQRQIAQTEEQEFQRIDPRALDTSRVTFWRELFAI